MIVYLSRIFELAAGGPIMPGTPAGVSAAVRGDLVSGFFESVGELGVRVV